MFGCLNNRKSNSFWILRLNKYSWALWNCQILLSLAFLIGLLLTASNPSRAAVRKSQRKLLKSKERLLTTQIGITKAIIQHYKDGLRARYKASIRGIKNIYHQVRTFKSNSILILMQVTLYLFSLCCLYLDYQGNHKTYIHLVSIERSIDVEGNLVLYPSLLRTHPIATQAKLLRLQVILKRNQITALTLRIKNPQTINPPF